MVIQRWQSVYLLIAAILMACYAFFPIAGTDSIELSLSGCEYVSSGVSNVVDADVLQEVLMWPFLSLTILISALSLVSIFKFKNLKLQKTLCSVCIVLTVVLMASLVVLLYGQTDINFYYSNLLPLLAVVAYVLAIRGISKDQKTLSSYDRLR